MLIKPKIETRIVNDSRKLCSLEIINSALGKVGVRVDAEDIQKNRFKTRLTNQNNEILGYDLFDISPEKSELFCYDITIEPKYRGNGLGELAKLVSIIEMIENKLKNFKLYSKNTSVYFHSKYKFEPNIKSFSHRIEALRNIAEKVEPEFVEYAKEAQNILNKIENTSMYSYRDQMELNKISNIVINEYIKQVMSLKAQKNASFGIGFDMQLTDDIVYKNAKFFNELFQKHGIDYKI